MGQDFHPNCEAEIATTVARSIPIESGDPSPLGFGAVMADQGTQVAGSRGTGGTRNTGDAGNVIDMTRRLPKYDIANPGLVRAISGFGGDQRQPSAATSDSRPRRPATAVRRDTGRRPHDTHGCRAGRRRKPREIYIKPGGDRAGTPSRFKMLSMLRLAPENRSTSMFRQEFIEETSSSHPERATSH